MVEQVNQGLVAVEQCDREAAAAYFDKAPVAQADILRGFWDREVIVQSHARHRIAERERCAQIAEERASEITQGIEGADDPQQQREWRLIAIELESIAKAIRSSSEGPKHDR